MTTYTSGGRRRRKPLKSRKRNKYGRSYNRGQRLTDSKIDDIQYFWALSEDIIDADIPGVRINYVCDQVQVTRDTVLKYVDFDGNLPKLGRPKWSGVKKTITVVCLLLGIIALFPTIYLAELVQEIENRSGIKMSKSLASKILKENKISKKKAVLYSYYRCTERVQRRRFEFRENIKNVDPRTIVFIDEMSCNYKDLSRLFGYSIIGSRANARVQRVQRCSFSLICAINYYGGIIWWEVHETSGQGINADQFAEFCDGLGSKMFENGIVDYSLLMDNARSHNEYGINTLKNWGIFNVIFIPPYSPDYNPIEYMFNLVKNQLKINENRVMNYVNNNQVDSMEEDDMDKLLGEILSKNELKDKIKKFITYSMKNWSNPSI